MEAKYNYDTNSTKYKILKYTFLISSILFSAFMFFKWFQIDTQISDAEDHSFLTIPGLIVKGVDAIKSYIGNGGTFVVLLTVGTLEYLCIVSAALGIWGITRTLIKKRRSRLLFASQITALCLMALTITISLIVNFISQKMLGGLVSMTPNIWLVLSLMFLVLSLVTGYFFSKFHSIETED